MSKIAWTWYLLVSMGCLGVNMLRYSHDGAEVLRFTGGYLVTSSVMIPLIGFIITSVQEKGKKRNNNR